MAVNTDSEILQFLWTEDPALASAELYTAGGEALRIIKRGERSSESVFREAEVEISGKIFRGDVVFGADRPWVNGYVVLQVLSENSDPLLTYDGMRIPQVVLKIPEQIKQCLDSLRAGAPYQECGLGIAEMDTVRRAKLFETLAFERLERKCREIDAIFIESDKDWQQTFYVMLLRAMGGNRNRKPYMNLTSRATYSMLLRERNSLEMVEALLLGTSGLLEGGYYDDYIHRLRSQFEYLQNKYGIEPMRASEWENISGYAAGSVIVRIVQTASFLSQKDFLFDKMLGCRRREDLHNLFGAEASEYWTDHYRPDERSKPFPKRLGIPKSDLLGINLVIPMMFEYGRHTGREELRENAVALYDQIPAETNRIINQWTGKGVALKNSMDSQALLQLNNEYCAESKCTVCPIGRSTIKKRCVAFDFQRK